MSSALRAVTPCQVCVRVRAGVTTPCRFVAARFVIDNIEKLLDTLRDCNVALRWAILHRRTAPKKLRETLLKGMLPKDRILQFLLNTVRRRACQWVGGTGSLTLANARRPTWNSG